MKFNLVGAMGMAVQVAILALLTATLRVQYLAATAVAVECTVSIISRGTSDSRGRIDLHEITALLAVASYTSISRLAPSQSAAISC
jgi:hypothetical protein